jgi:hypothetical protein
VCHPLSAPEQNRPHQFLQSSSAVFACHHWERSQFDPGSREELSAGQLPALCGVSVDSEWVQNVPCLQHLPCPYAWSSNRSQSGLVHIWSLQTRRAVTTLDGHGGQSVTWLQLLPQGSQLLRWVMTVVNEVPKEPVGLRSPLIETFVAPPSL